MHIRITLQRDAPGTDLAGYPDGRISGYSKSRIPDILPDIWFSQIPDIRLISEPITGKNQIK